MNHLTQLLAAGCLVFLLAGAAAVAQPATQPATQPAKPPTHGWLGAKLETVTDDIAEQLGLDEPGGVAVVEVFPETPAQAGGLREEDVIRRVDDTDVDDVHAFVAAMRTTRPGQEVTFSVVRAKQPLDLKIKLGTRPGSVPPLPPPTTRPR